MGWVRILALGVALLVAVAAPGCGNSDKTDKRQRERCDACDPAQIDPHCVDQCVPFCVAGDPDCASRCDQQCDRCKADLECRTCSSDCTGTTARCAPADVPLTCDDGVF